MWAVVTGNDHVLLAPTVQGRVDFTVVPDPLAGARSGEKAPIVYQSDAGGGVTHSFVVDARGGTSRQLTDGPARDNRPVWSLDGRQIAFARFENNQWNIYVINADASDTRRLTQLTAINTSPSWPMK